MNRRIERFSREETIRQMNRFGSERIPFIFLISFSGEKNCLATPEQAAQAGFFLQLPGMHNHSLSAPAPEEFSWEVCPVERERYRTAFESVQREILYGNSFLLNLTFPSKVETGLTLGNVFAISRAPFRLLIEDELVVFSPERFVRITGRTISSNPMKGTIDAALPGAYNRLATDPKEDAEHNTIVDLIRNDLSRVATRVRVRRFKYIERLRTHRGDLLQMSSEITGTLPEDYRHRLGEILFQLLPAGSISGAPKAKTLEIIRQAEGYDRGYYTGVFGYWDGTGLDSAVAIRFLEHDAGGLVFKSGGGVTFRSKWEDEYNEMVRKVYVPLH